MFKYFKNYGQVKFPVTAWLLAVLKEYAEPPQMVTIYLPLFCEKKTEPEFNAKVPKPLVVQRT